MQKDLRPERHRKVFQKERRMKIAMGNDHAAVEMKKELLRYLEEKGIEVINVGTDTAERYDYPLAGFQVARLVKEGKADLGIAICGTGIGISLSCNKVEGIRAFPCSEPYSARMARQHNNANVLCLGARVIGVELAKMIVDTFLSAEFEGGRHAERVQLISEIEEDVEKFKLEHFQA